MHVYTYVYLCEFLTLYGVGKHIYGKRYTVASLSYGSLCK